MINLEKVNEVKDLVSQLEGDSQALACEFISFLYTRSVQKLQSPSEEESVILLDNMSSSDITKILKVTRCLVTEQELSQLSLDLQKVQEGKLSLSDLTANYEV